MIPIFKLVKPISLAGAFFSGLALCNQHTIIFYLLPIIFSILFLLFKSHQLNWKLFLQLALLFFLALTPYLYLVLSSYNPQIGNWGDMRTWKGNIPAG